jgi:3-oxoacyl-[acyl-carrier-protein] synthase-1
VNLETLSIEPDENRICFTWRAAVPCDRKALKVEKIVVGRGRTAAVMSAVIGASHVLCSIGSGTDQVWAAARAGIGRITSSYVMDRDVEPIQMGLAPEDSLPLLDPEIDKLPLPSRARRMLRLAAPSLQAIAKDLERPVPVFIGLPELKPAESSWMAHVPAYLQKITGAAIDRERSAVVPHGRAAGLMALELALNTLQSDPTATVIVGGVDTHLDLRLLALLEHEKRILGPRVMDGFIPGEGAAFYVLTGASSAQPPIKRSACACTRCGVDDGSRSPLWERALQRRGAGSRVESAPRQRAGQLPGQVATTFAGFNGENFRR